MSYFHFVFIFGALKLFNRSLKGQKLCDWTVLFTNESSIHYCPDLKANAYTDLHLTCRKITVFC